MKNVLYCMISLFLISVLGSSLYFNTVLVDSQAYTLSVYYLQEKTLLQEDNERVLASYAFSRPLSLFVVALLEPVLGVRLGFSLFNLFLYTLSAILVYYYFTRLYENKIVGFIAGILYAFSLPLLIYGTRVMSDITGYLFLIAGILLIDRGLQKNTLTNHLLINAYIGISLLAREYCLILIPYYFLSALFKKKEDFFALRQRIKETLGKVLSSILIPVPSIIFSKFYHSIYFFSDKVATFSKQKITMLGFAKFFLILLSSFHIGWFFAFIGLRADNNESRRIKYLIFAISALPLVIGGYLFALFSPRMVFIFFPLVIGAAAYGIYSVGTVLGERYKKSSVSIIIAFLLLYGIISYLGAWLYPAHNIIAEDAGGDIVIQALMGEIKLKVGGLFL